MDSHHAALLLRFIRLVQTKTSINQKVRCPIVNWITSEKTFQKFDLRLNLNQTTYIVRVPAVLTLTRCINSEKKSKKSGKNFQHIIMGGFRGWIIIRLYIKYIIYPVPVTYTPTPEFGPSYPFFLHYHPPCPRLKYQRMPI